MWRLISLLLGLLAFCLTGAVLLLNGEDPLYAVMKAIGSFVVLWMLFSILGFVFGRVMPLDGEDESPDGGEGPAPSAVSDMDLPMIG